MVRTVVAKSPIMETAAMHTQAAYIHLCLGLWDIACSSGQKGRGCAKNSWLAFGSLDRDLGLSYK